MNLQEGVKLAKDICHGMRYIHTVEPIVNRFDLNPHNIVVSISLCLCLCLCLPACLSLSLFLSLFFHQVDGDLTARIDLSRYRFSFVDANHIYYPQWCAPEGISLSHSHSLSLSLSALQKRPDEIDKRAADMYGFALILWEIATGKLPYAGLSPMMAGLKVYHSRL